MKIAIKGNASKGEEVIQILESLGGKNTHNYKGEGYLGYYLIVNNNIEYFNNAIWIENTKLYTLEEFEKEFPFKIGDEVVFPVKVGWASGKVTGLTYVEEQLKYEVYVGTSGYHYVEPYKLQLYPMKEERNITLTIDKAKEWYKKGGELKEVALQAYSEEELTKIDLPKTWEEFCENYPVQNGESWLDGQDRIFSCTADSNGVDRRYKNWTPSVKSAEAHLAMIQLEQLRDCWRQGWVPDYDDDTPKSYITIGRSGAVVRATFYESRFLTFQDTYTAVAFSTRFSDLIKKAGDLI